MTQDQAFEILKSGKNVFLTGEPGAGKTYTINRFIDWLETQGRYADITASTGIAATHINGMTIHSWAGMGIKENLSQTDIEYILNKPYVMRKFMSCDVLIIDEISMLDAQKIEDISNVLSIARNGLIIPDKPFGGIQVVFVGDFYQLPPVAKDKEQKFAFESHIWNDLNLEVCYLTEQHRQSDKMFMDILQALRSGTITEEHKEVLRGRKLDVPQGLEITELHTHNRDVDHVNYRELAKIKLPAEQYRMTAEGNEWMVKKLKDQCLSPELLTLKIGALVMFTRNKFDQDTGQAVYVNGTIGIVEELGHFPVVRIKGGERVVLERAVWELTDRKKVLASIKQFPLRLAYAITVHKSQGMSLDAALIDLSHAFEYGQGYVALSRVRSLEGLYLKGINARGMEMHPKVVEQDKIFRQQL